LSASGSQGGLKSREVLPEKKHMDLKTLNFNSLSFVGFSGEGKNLRGGSCLVFHFILYNSSFLCFLILFFVLSFLSFLSYFPICFFLLFFLFPFIPVPASSSSCSLKAFFGKRRGDAQNDIQKAAEQEWCFKQLMIYKVLDAVQYHDSIAAIQHLGGSWVTSLKKRLLALILSATKELIPLEPWHWLEKCGIIVQSKIRKQSERSGGFSL
jgi:hypothetical protein